MGLRRSRTADFRARRRPNYKSLGNQLNSLGLERTAVTVSTAEANPISDSPAIRQAGVDRLKKVVEACQAAGVEKLCGPLHSALGQFSGRGTTPGRMELVQRHFRSRKSLNSRGAGVILVVEYLNRFECYFLNSAADTARFVSEVNHPNVRMMYDTFHANIEEKSVAKAIKDCAARAIARPYFRERSGERRARGTSIGTRHFRALRETGYDGWFVVEAFVMAAPRIGGSHEDLAADVSVGGISGDAGATIHEVALGRVRRRLWRELFTTGADPME